MKLFQIFESKELGAELLKLQKFISQNDLHTQLEIDDGKIVIYQDGEEFDRWHLSDAVNMRTKVLNNYLTSYFYAWSIYKKRFELGEPVIATHDHQSYQYAFKVLKGPFKLGEPVISKDAYNSYLYAKDVVKGRFELGEFIISKSDHYSYRYAIDVLKNRFELGEPAISKDADIARDYKKFLAKILKLKSYHDVKIKSE